MFKYVCIVRVFSNINRNVLMSRLSNGLLHDNPPPPQKKSYAVTLVSVTSAPISRLPKFFKSYSTTLETTAFRILFCQRLSSNLTFQRSWVRTPLPSPNQPKTKHFLALKSRELVDVVSNRDLFCCKLDCTILPMCNTDLWPIL